MRAQEHRQQHLQMMQHQFTTTLAVVIRMKWTSSADRCSRSNKTQRINQYEQLQEQLQSIQMNNLDKI